MERPLDFLNLLDTDMSVKIFTCLDNPTDLAKLCVVSKAWYRFVIENKLCKQNFLKKYPEASKITSVFEFTEKSESTSGILGIPRFLARDHRVFSFLTCYLRAMVHSIYRANLQIEGYISASSNGKLPENVKVLRNQPVKWCSKGKSDPTIPEILVCKLAYSLAVVHEIIVEAFQENSASKFPFYSARDVRFSFGYENCPGKPEGTPISLAPQGYDDDMFVWTYTSPTYRMTSGFGRHGFCLPRPVLCIGKVMKVEFLGGVHKNDFDGLYYISVSSVEVLGYNLMPMFGTYAADAGNCSMMCDFGDIYKLGMQLIERFRFEADNSPLSPETSPTLYSSIRIPPYKSFCRYVDLIQGEYLTMAWLPW